MCRIIGQMIRKFGILGPLVFRKGLRFRHDGLLTGLWELLTDFGCQYKYSMSIVLRGPHARAANRGC